MLPNVSLSTTDSGPMLISSPSTMVIPPSSCDHSLEVIFWILNSIVGILILVGNTFTCAVFLSTDQLRQNVMNIFLVSLAISDISMAVLVIPGFSVFCGGCKYTLSGYCWLFGAARDIAFPAPTYNLLAITYDRYTAVLCPLQYMSKMTRPRVIVILLLVWILPLIQASIRNIWQHTWPKDAVNAANKVYNAFLVSAVVLLPLVVMLVVNLLIIKTIKKHTRTVHPSVQSQATSSAPIADNSQPNSTSFCTGDSCERTAAKNRSLERARRIKGTLSCVMVVFIFIAAWLPRVYYNFCRLTGVPVSPMLTKISLFLLLLQSSVNPFIYSFYRSDFRRASRALMRRLKCW